MRTVLILIMPLLLVACGKTGDLYLPEDTVNKASIQTPNRKLAETGE